MASPVDYSQSVWFDAPWTTTPEERLAPTPYTYPAIQINLFFRVALGITSLFVTWVPARLLWRNGEFAGTVFCVMLLVINLLTVINALIWRDNNVQEWWIGHGWCDLQAYLQYALHSAFNISLFEIMRGLASKVALNRAIKPTRSERRRERIVSAMVIFTVPVLQVALNYLTTITRYNINTLVGCTPTYMPSWITLVFYVLPIPAFAIAAGVMAGVTFRRYRKIEKVTTEISRSQGGISAARQERVRKKLYFITLAAIIFVLPLTSAMMVLYIIEGMPWNQPYDFGGLHFGPDPYNIYFITFTTYQKMSFSQKATDLIAELAGILIFIPFGTTPEAINMYRKILRAAGLGYIFPKLNQDYEPSLTPGPKFGWGSISLKGKSLLASITASTRKDSILPTTEHISLSSRADRAASSSAPRQAQPLNFIMNINTPQHPVKVVASSSIVHRNPWPDLSAEAMDAATAQIEAATREAAVGWRTSHDKNNHNKNRYGLVDHSNSNSEHNRSQTNRYGMVEVDPTDLDSEERSLHNFSSSAAS
ncbi:hypothetical protein VTI74DRAFT_719 [Chaetomium olivicolor]